MMCSGEVSQCPSDRLLSFFPVDSLSLISHLSSDMLLLMNFLQTIEPSSRTGVAVDVCVERHSLWWTKRKRT